MTMDHPEPVPVKQEINIPQSRKTFTLEEAKQFIEQIMETFRSLESMLDLRSMYDTGKQLSRIFFDCHQYRSQLAQHLTTLEYPNFASKMMKKLNNMGVFKNDDIWFSSFYFYNTTWNFSDIWPEFASALGTAGLPNLLNLNIGHQPYLENLASKNVYYLIKASLSIIHNIARVPSNVHYFSTDAVRQALLHLSQRDEEFLKCVSTLCLAHILSDSEASFMTTSQQNNQNSLQSLITYVTTARNSEKHRCHGLQVADLLSALTALSVNDSIKSSLLTTPVPGNEGLVDMLKEILESTFKSDASPALFRDAEEAIKILCNLATGPQSSCSQFLSQLGSWHTDLLNNPSQFSHLTKGVAKSLEMLVWRLTTGGAPRNNPMKNQLNQQTGLIMMSYASANKPAVDRIMERIRMQGFRVIPQVEPSDEIFWPEACAVRLSGLQAFSPSQLSWLDQMDAAEIVIVCSSDVYRQSPACRFEADYLQEHINLQNKHVIFLNLQSKYKPTGWLQTLITSGANLNKPIVDFSGKKDIESSYDALFMQLSELHDVCKQKAQAHQMKHQHEVVQSTPGLHGTESGGRNTTSPPPVASYPPTNHLDIRDGSLPPQNAPTIGGDFNRIGVRNNSLITYPIPASQSSQVLRQPSGIRVWKSAVRAEIRNWSSAKVAQWFKFRGLQNVTSSLTGGLDGVMLSQLASMRISAPEAFHNILRDELSLKLLDSLKMLEALDELAPDDIEDEQLSNKPHNGGTGAESSRGDEADEAYEKFSTESQHRLMQNSNGQRVNENYHF